MRQALAAVLAGAMAIVVPLRASDHKASNDVRSALEFFEGHGDVSIDEFLGRMRPPPIDAIERAAVIAAMPLGAIRADAHALAQMSLGEQVLAYHGRGGLVTFTIIKVAQAFIGLHDRAVILVSAKALPLLKKEEFAALVAHEIGHEYVWTDYRRAVQRHDQARIRELELRCDGIAVLTLRRVGLDAEPLVRAVGMLTWYNQELGLDGNQRDYVSLGERRAFIRAVEILQWADGPGTALLGRTTQQSGLVRRRSHAANERSVAIGGMAGLPEHR
jgi:hypothetical protein